MPRIARGLSDGHVYHVLNRGNCRQQIFHKEGDYQAFCKLLAEAKEAYDVDIFAYCLMPNHFHFLLQTRKAEDLSKFMQWLMTSHVRRYHRHYGTSGHVWQGRYKSFIVQKDEHLLTVARYIEGNPVRAQLTESAKGWQWSSHIERISEKEGNVLTGLPIPLPINWTEYVDQALTTGEIERLRKSINRQSPYGNDNWIEKLCNELGLESTIRQRGRPKKDRKK